MCTRPDKPLYNNKDRQGRCRNRVKRPNYSVLNNYMMKSTNSFRFPEWKFALMDYLKTKQQNQRDFFHNTEE